MRIRTIKPEFWGHELLAKTSEFARLLAIALLNYADDDGYFLAAPQSIRGAVFPFEDDSRKIHGALTELSQLGYIRLGKLDDGRAVGQVVKFADHQVINRPQASKFKASSSFTECSVNDHGSLTAGMEGNGTGNGKERNRDKGWEPSPEQVRVGSWFHMRPTTPWDAKAVKAWKSVPELHPDDLDSLEAYYTAPEAQAPYRRHDLCTLLNNWTGEVIRSRKFKPTPADERLF